MVSSEMGADSLLASSLVTGQEVQVYQSYNGKQLFRMDCSPVERAGQNFALSDDGLRLAVVRESMVHHAATKDYDAYTERSTAVEVYPLPPLTDKDRAAVKQRRRGLRLTAGRGSMFRWRGVQRQPMRRLRRGRRLRVTAEARVEPRPGNAEGTAAGDVGDVEPAAPRKPPTLYGPGETPPEKKPQ
jgi:hypothetical protein